MKKASKLFALTSLMALFVSSFLMVGCKKSENTPTCSDGIKNQNEVDLDCGGSCQPCAIKYPEWGLHGLNLLFGNDTLWLPGTGNSFMAVVPEGSSLKIELSLISGFGWGYYLDSKVGWAISKYSNNMQTFDILNPGTSEVKIIRNSEADSGVILIKFFENSISETRRKILIWN